MRKPSDLFAALSAVPLIGQKDWPQLPFAADIDGRRFVAATNGHFLVAVEAGRVLGTANQMPVGVRNVLDRWKAGQLEQTIQVDAGTLARFAATGTCKTCHDAESLRCEDCNGKGEFKCECIDCGDQHVKECRVCRGRGKKKCKDCLHGNDAHAAKLVHGVVSRRQLSELLRVLGLADDAVVSVSKTSFADAYDFSGDGWSAVLMPMNETGLGPIPNLAHFDRPETWEPAA